MASHAVLVDEAPLRGTCVSGAPAEDLDFDYVPICHICHPNALARVGRGTNAGGIFRFRKRGGGGQQDRSSVGLDAGLQYVGQLVKGTVCSRQAGTS